MSKSEILRPKQYLLDNPDSLGTKPWGYHLLLNLYDCDPHEIRSYESLRDFVIDLCVLINVRRYGDPTIVHFGEDPLVEGYSLFQLIETSSICGHFVNISNSAYIDVFSCKPFDAESAAAFCRGVFSASRATGGLIERG